MKISYELAKSYFTKDKKDDKTPFERAIEVRDFTIIDLVLTVEIDGKSHLGRPITSFGYFKSHCRPELLRKLLLSLMTDHNKKLAEAMIKVEHDLFARGNDEESLLLMALQHGYFEAVKINLSSIDQNHLANYLGFISERLDKDDIISIVKILQKNQDPNCQEILKILLQHPFFEQVTVELEYAAQQAESKEAVPAKYTPRISLPQLEETYAKQGVPVAEQVIDSMTPRTLKALLKENMFKHSQHISPPSYEMPLQQLSLQPNKT